MTSPQKKPSIICFGEVLWDITPTTQTPGGAPMNVAMHLQNLGATANLISKVGDDALGEGLLAYMSERISTEYIQKDFTYGTSKVQVDLSDPTEAKYVFDTPTAWDEIELTAANSALVANADAFVFGSLASRGGGTTRQTLLALLKEATKSVFDVNFREPFYSQELIELGLKHASVAKLNDEEMSLVCQWYGFEGTEEGQMRFLASKFQLEALCLTRGANGAYLLEQGQLYQQGGFKVEVQDTIGAGDSFLATYLYQWLLGAPPQQRLQYACAMGALVSSYRGANPPITLTQVEEML